MQRIIKSVLLAACLGLLPACTSEQPDEGESSAESPTYGSVWHVVVFRFKSDAASMAAVTQGRTVNGQPAPSVIDAFRDLQRTVVAPDDSTRKLIRSFDYGVNNSTEQLSFGKKGEAQSRTNEYEFIVTFDSVADRDYYVDKAPTHQDFKKLVGEYLEVPEGGTAADSVFVADFTAVKR